MEYIEARRLLKHALENQKTIKIEKLKELLESMNIDLYKPTDKTELMFLRTKVGSMKVQMDRMLREKNTKTQELEDRIRIIRTKKGKPTLIVFDGERYIWEPKSNWEVYGQKNR